MAAVSDTPSTPQLQRSRKQQAHAHYPSTASLPPCPPPNVRPGVGEKDALLTDVPYAKEEVAAVADANFDYPGACGRCYQVN
jgi:hypothetical protein